MKPSPVRSGCLLAPVHVRKVNSSVQAGDSFCRTGGKDTYPQNAFGLLLDNGVEHSVFCCTRRSLVYNIHIILKHKICTFVACPDNANGAIVKNNVIVLKKKKKKTTPTESFSITLSKIRTSSVKEGLAVYGSNQQSFIICNLYEKTSAQCLYSNASAGVHSSDQRFSKSHNVQIE